MNTDTTTAEQILELYPTKLPIIIDIDEKSNIQLEKKKYIVPKDITLRQFHCILSKNLILNSKQSVIMFINNTLPILNDTIENVYKINNVDGFLYIQLNIENTFG